MMHNKKKTITVFIFILFGVLFVGCMILCYLNNQIKPNPVGTLGNTAGNLQNGGLFCEDNGIVYFSNPYDNGALYSMNPDESNIKKITPGNIQFINSAGKYLYFYNAGTSSGDGLGHIFQSAGFFRYKKGSKEKPVYLKKGTGVALSLIDNHLYYETYDLKNHLTLYKMKTDGSEEKELSKDNVNPSCIAPSAFLYSNPDANLHLQYWNTTSDSSREILSAKAFHPIVLEQNVYFIDVSNNYSLSCLNLNTGEVTSIIKERVDCFNIAGNTIYYQSVGKDYALKSAQLDGSNVTTISLGVYQSIHVTSQYVYVKPYHTQTPIYKIPVGGSTVSTFDAAKLVVEE